MKRSPRPVPSRRPLIEALSAGAGPPALLVTRGAPGSGRSTVLAVVGDELAASGWTVLTVGAGGTLAALLDAVRENFEVLTPGSGPTHHVRALDELLAQPEPPRVRLDAAVEGMLAALGGRARLAVLVDDVDPVTPPLWLITARDAGLAVVAATTGDTDETFGEPELYALADHVVTLGPLDRPDAEHLAEATLGAPPDDALVDALLTAAGTAHPCPRLLVELLEDLRGTDRVGMVHGRWTLRPGERPLAPPQLRLADVAAGPAAAHLMVLAGDEVDLRLDDVPLLARAVGGNVTDYADETERQLRAGNLALGPRGELRSACPALTEAGRRDLGAAAVGDLHRRLAHAVATDARDSLVGTALVIDLLGGAGPGPVPELPPHIAAGLDDPAVLDTTADPARAAHRHRTAWRYSPSFPRRDRYRSGTIAWLVGAGRYEELEAFVAEAVTDLAEDDDPCPGRAPHASLRAAHARRELAAAATLAALHLGRPVGAEVRDAVRPPSGDGSRGDVLALERRWFDGEPVHRDEIEAGLEVLGIARTGLGDTGPAEAAPDGLRPGNDLPDVVTIRTLVPTLEELLGARYGPPVAGLAHLVSQLSTCVWSGDWARALSAARRLSLVDGLDQDTRDWAALHAAEMCRWRGHDREADAWLATVGPTPRLIALRARVEVAAHRRESDLATALALGWDAYRRGVEVDPDDPHSWLLLSVLVSAAVQARDDGWLRTIHAEAVRRSDAEVPEALRAFILAVAGRDPDAALAALDPALGNVPCLGRVQGLIAVGLLEPDPLPRLTAARDLVETIDAPRLHRHIRHVMEDHGHKPPRPPSPTPLGPLEREIVGLVRAGHTNRQIARAVSIAEKTVEKHLTRLYQRTGCRSRSELAAFG